MPPRSPLIFWLLLAATICVDAAAISWMSTNPAATFPSVVVDALFLGQLSVICIWAALASTNILWKCLAPVLAVVACAMVQQRFDPLQFSNGLAYYGFHAGLLLTALWFFKRSKFWRERSGVAAKWRYSMAHLLIAMTVVALLVAAMRNSRLFYGDRFGVAWTNIAFIGSSVALAMASLVSWCLAWHWFIRLAGALGFAVLLGVAIALLETVGVIDGYFNLFAMIISANYLIQAAVISAWLGLGPVLPIEHAPAVET